MFLPPNTSDNSSDYTTPPQPSSAVPQSEKTTKTARESNADGTSYSLFPLGWPLASMPPDSIDLWYNNRVTFCVACHPHPLRLLESTTKKKKKKGGGGGAPKDETIHLPFRKGTVGYPMPDVLPDSPPWKTRHCYRNGEAGGKWSMISPVLRRLRKREGEGDGKPMGSTSQHLRVSTHRVRWWRCKTFGWTPRGNKRGAYKTAERESWERWREWMISARVETVK